MTLDDVVQHITADPRHTTAAQRHRGEVVSGIFLATAHGVAAYLPECPERDEAMRGLVTVHEQSQRAVAALS